METALGEILPLAIGITISPVPIIATILMLLSPRAATTSVGFLVGWVLGTIATITVFTLMSTVIAPADPEAPRPIAGVVAILLGLALMALAVRGYRGRPREGDEPALPGWMSAIDSMSATRATILGLVLSAANPKNLLLCAGAGLAIGTASLDIAASSVAIVVFTVVATASVTAPVILYAVARDRMTAPLESLRVWLTMNNATVMAVLMLVIGVVMIGKGIERF